MGRIEKSGKLPANLEKIQADKLRGEPRPVTLVGVNFNPSKRNIGLPLIEPL